MNNKLHKHTLLCLFFISELKNCNEICSICRFNISLYNHTMALALFIIWCVKPNFYLFVASGSFRITSFCIELIIMISSASFLILVLIYILKFYLFHKFVFNVDNDSECNVVLTECTCGKQKDKSKHCEQNEC